MGRYRYRPLPGDAFIRLATIHPGAWDEDIVISLKCVPFDPDNPPCYQALSYVWGSKKHLKTIYVGVSDRLTLRVTSNLKVALQHLRLVDETRVLWIDALCINQFDDIEKGPQVAMMGEIFHRAAMVVAWLGPERNNSSLALEALGYLGAQIRVNWGTLVIDVLEDSPHQSLGDPSTPLLLSTREQESIAILLCRPWFGRLWVRQELYLAESAMMVCGHCEVPWPDFRRAVHCFRTHWSLMAPTAAAHISPRAELIGGFFYQTTYISLRQLRLLFQDAECQDPRDRIFAVRSLFSNHEQSVYPLPDYTKAAPEIYKEVALSFLALHHTGFDILRHCELHGKLVGPSWVPDWSVKVTLPLAGNSPRCRLVPRGMSFYQPSSPGSLRVLGVRKMVIREVQQIDNLLSPALYNALSHQKALLNLARFVVTSGHDPPDTPTIGAFATALIYGQGSEFRIPSFQTLQTTDKVIEIVSRFVLDVHSGEKEFVQGDEVQFFLKSFARCCSRRKFVRCTGHYIGNAPPLAKEGDEIWMIVGCDAPMVLRRTGDQRFVVVGDCFVQGLCHGEGLLGPLPGDVRPRFVFREDRNTWATGFENVRTGHIFHEDPRLEKLPVDLTEYRQVLSHHPNMPLQVSPEILLGHISGLKEIELV